MMLREAMTEIGEQFAQHFGRAPDWVVSAPGRVNLIGEHTDYNDGFVLPMAIDKQTLIAAGTNPEPGEPCVRAFSVNLNDSDEFILDSDRLRRTGRWTDYIKGVFAEFLDRGLAPASLDMVVSTTVPIGCGLSSSAALQVATAVLLKQLDNSLVNDAAIAELCQRAEHGFTGVPVGIMDQFCIVNARAGHLVFLDCRSITAEYVPFDEPDLAVLIINTHVSRELRSGTYAERRAQCAEACEILGVGALRDARPASVEAAKGKLGELRCRRARHVCAENTRTVQAVAAIRRKDWPGLGKLMYASHESLRRDFEVSCEELDILVGLARQLGADGGVIGARMTGGGFGGCMVALIQRHRAGEIVDQLTNAYRAATGIDLSAYLSRAAAGARLLHESETEPT